MKKFLGIDAGRIKEFLGITSSAGAGDADKIIATNASGKLDETFLPSGVGAEIYVVVASEALGAGDYVNIWNDAGTAKARLADASDPAKEANGFVLAAVSLGNNATVYQNDENNQVSGMTPGTAQYLSASTPGGIVETPPSGSGNIVQYLGKAASATALETNIARPIELV